MELLRSRQSRKPRLASTHCSIKTILCVGLFYSLAGLIFADRAFAAAVIPTGYSVHQSVDVDPTEAGIAGSLQILQDRRITPTLRKLMWGISNEPDFVLSEDDVRQKQFAVEPLRHAHLRLVDLSGRVTVDEQFDVPLAEIKVAHLYGTSFPTYLVTLDYSIGMGSYAGPTTTFAEIRNGHLAFVHASETGGTRDTQLSLMRSLKADWRIVRGDKGNLNEILSVACRPDFRDPNRDDFIIIYSTFRFDGMRWHLSLRQQVGFWENEGENSWPDRGNFP